MKREKEVPADLLDWLETRKQKREIPKFDKMNLFYTMPTRAVKMKILNDDMEEGFRTVIIPAIDIYMTKRAVLKKGFFKRDALYFFVSGTSTPFPYGHVYANSGSICLGNIFVPSAVPERSPAMPIETLFLHNDRNLHHGESHLYIDMKQAETLRYIIRQMDIKPSKLAMTVLTIPGDDIIANDEIWCLSADVAAQKPLPEALNIMRMIYHVIF